MSDDLTPEEIRNAAICLLAIDYCLCDTLVAERAVEFARKLERSLEEDPLWRDGRHEGDCTRHIHTCVRCLFEEAERVVQKIYNGDYDF